MAEADRIQAASEKKASNKGGHRKHRDGMVAQACGPLRKILLPYGHSRGSQSALVRKFYSCHVAARSVNFGHLKALLGIGPKEPGDPDVEDDMPLDVLFNAMQWRPPIVGE